MNSKSFQDFENFHSKYHKESNIHAQPWNKGHFYKEFLQLTFYYPAMSCMLHGIN
jgi:hypothetical protein